MKRIAVIIVIGILIAACAMPEAKIFSIHIPDGNVKNPALGSPAEGPSVAVTITAPRYLSQPYIAVRNSPYELEISRYAKWESSPDDIVRNKIRDSLSSNGIFKEVRASAVVPEGYLAIEIDLKRFERSDEANEAFAILVYDIKLYSPETKEIYRANVSRKVKLGEKTFVSLAKGLSNALSESIKEVSTGLAEIMKK